MSDKLRWTVGGIAVFFLGLGLVLQVVAGGSIALSQLIPFGSLLLSVLLWYWLRGQQRGAGR